MSTGRFQSFVLRFAVVSGIAISLMQCSKPEVVRPPLSSNLFPCTGARSVHIKTQVGAPGVSPEYVVLCNNDTITWDTDPSAHADHFTVAFKSTSPIKGSDGNRKLTFSDNANDSSGTADDTDVGNQGQYMYYAYSIDVVDDANQNHHYDPGVIIVK